MSIEAMKQAEKLLVSYQDFTGDFRIANLCGETINALRQAIEQAEKQFNPDWDQQAVLVERIRELEAQQALDKKADNARELGLDYEPDPVAWVCEGFGKEKHNLDYVQDDIDALEIGTALYTAPPRKEWVGLTDAELAEFSNMKLGAYDLCLEVEAKLREKNGG